MYPVRCLLFQVRPMQVQITHRLELPSLPDWRRYVNPWRVVPLVVMLAPWVNYRADLVLSTLPGLPSFPVSVASGARSVSPHRTQPIHVGDKIAGYKVTSAYGLRSAPCIGCSSMHPAIDVATPAGTPVYAPAPVEVACKTDSRSGNYAEFEFDGVKHQLLHLNKCTPGKAASGQPIGATGSSGAGTGPHLDIRVKQDGERVLPSKEVIAAILDPATTSPTDQELKNAIGRAEGTRDANGDPTAAYQGHKDPGNGKRNMGSFSYQHGATTPEEADRQWLKVLREAEQRYQDQARAKYGHPLSRAALVAILDAHTQSPDAASRLLSHLPTHDPTPEQLITARTAALQESRAAIGGPPMNVQADQTRRIEAALDALK
ncbi:MAG: M23 family metallopeptidase [Chitinophagia bacterium]|nr:M23 family metallopeptidase [Chitinophagia bacterium]